MSYIYGSTIYMRFCRGLDVYVEDNFGRVQQLTFSFNNEREEGKDKPVSSRH